MPSITIKFNLPEESEEYKIASKASDYYCALDDFREVLRAERKYGKDRWEEVEKKFWEILKEREIEL